MADLFVGSTIAGCRLDAVAGRGGMGVVYRATQLALDRPVALKAMAPQLATDAEYRERFERESHLAASIDHPNVIPVYEAGESEGTLYLIMRWVQGTDLRALLTSSGRLDPAHAVKLLRPVASALAAAHRRGLVHRDVKPANVLIAEGEVGDDEHVYLTDFGIAKRTDTQRGMTRTGVLVGTIDYTAPERIEGGRGTPASDIYAFGCMLYETLTGHVPFERATELLKMYAHMNDPAPSARDEVPEIPPQLDAIIARAMAKRPEQRYASGSELASALGRWLEQTGAGTQSVQGEPPDAVPTELLAETVAPRPAATPPPTPATRRPPGRSRRPPGRSRRPLLAALALIAVIAVVVGVIVASSGGARGGGAVSASAGGMTADEAGNMWVSRPADGTLTRIAPNGRQQQLHVGGKPTLLAAGPAGIWESNGRALELRDTGGRRLARVTLPSPPVALAASPKHGEGWAAEPDGTLLNVNTAGQLQPSSPRVTPAPVAITLGAGWLWGVSEDKLTRIGTLGNHPITQVSSGASRAVAVTSNRGIWTAHADGTVTRFDPRTQFFKINARQRIAPQLNAIAAAEGSPFVWATSATAKELYRLPADGDGPGQRMRSFPTPPVGLAVLSHSVWVLTRDGKLAQISF